MGRRFQRLALPDLLAVAAGVAALVLVAVGAGGGGGRAAFRYTHRTASTVAIVLGVAAAVTLVVALAVALAMRRRDRPWSRQILAAVAILGVLALFAWWFSPQLANAPRRGQSGAAGTPPTPSPDSSPPMHINVSSLPIVPIAIGCLAAAMVVAAIVVGVRQRLFRAMSPDDESAADAAVFAVIDAGDDAMRDIADPRQAIIACYAAMERALADVGVRRLAAETPTDLLARAAQFHDAHPAARRLTQLFLEARFSTHPMSTVDRDAARAALARLRSPTSLAARSAP
jgi:hypothetical protein